MTNDEAGPSRRAFVPVWLRAQADDAPSSSVPPAPTVPVFQLLRPPGAVEEAGFLALCTRCDDCIRVCPTGTIARAPTGLPGAAGTPMLLPQKAPCELCADRPCVSACETGALRPNLPTAIGTAVIDHSKCLAYTGSFCSTCAERCPVPETISLSLGRPTINPDHCNGCGICTYRCPAPELAVTVSPTHPRPDPSDPNDD